MAESSRTQWVKNYIVYPALAALLVGSTTPFWWNDAKAWLFGKEKNQNESIPVASAGDDDTVWLPVDHNSVLDGSGSSLQGGSITSYAWKKKSGPAGGDIVEPSSRKTEVRNFSPGKYEFVLTVTGSNQQTATASVYRYAKKRDAMIEGPIEYPFDFTNNDWGTSINNDNEVGSGDNKQIYSYCTANLSNTDKRVTLTLEFFLEERGDNHTRFHKTKKVPVYEADLSKKIVGLRVNGNDLNFRREAWFRGQNHRPVSYPNLTNTYFTRLAFVGDGLGPNDNEVIGLQGNIRFEVMTIDR